MVAQLAKMGVLTTTSIMRPFEFDCFYTRYRHIMASAEQTRRSC